ncbi:MAG: hypothetical protein ACXWLR_07240 [Myxococcales bacterium]
MVHLFVIHAAAMLAVTAAGYPGRTMVFPGSQEEASPLLKGRFGYGHPGTYAVWACVVFDVYPLCARWNSLKGRHQGKWWVSYV